MNRKDIPVLSGLSLLTFVLVAPAAAQQPPVTPVAPVGAAVPGVAPAIAPAAAYNPSRVIKMHPDEKRPLLLTERERNPYARRSPDASPINENGENEEEIQIRQSLTSLSVTGQVRGGSNGLRVLLGDIILEKGRILPQLLPEQSENLQVVEVTEENVVFAWLDIETGEPTGKTMQLPYDVSPSVPYVLSGQQRGAESASSDLRMGVMRIGQERRKQESRMAANDPAKKLPPEVYKAGQ
jgi:hypothetical protein